MKLLILFGFILLSLPDVHASSQSESVASPLVKAEVKEVYDYDIALKTSQDAIGGQLGDHLFIDATGRPVSMKTFMGKPLILSMVYTSCYQICPMTTRHLAKIVEKARLTFGKDSFSVALIGFDTSVDTPEAMQYFAKKQGVHDKDWNLLSIDTDDIDRLAKDIGFIYFPSVNGFDHLIQTTIIDAQSRVYRQVYGQVFDTPLLIEPLKELILGHPQQNQTFFSELTSKIKLFCTIYDPVRDGYYFDYSLFLGILIGAMIILLISIFLVKEIRKNRQHPNT